MASHAKVANAIARQLFAMSVVDGVVSAERVSGVLQYVEIHKTANPVMVLKAYQRLIATELAKGVAVVEHAGTVNDTVLAAIAASMTKKYSRKVVATAKPNASLLAGLRIRVGDDVYESSIAGQLAALATSV
jgi:F-type H+-transporting ATPase subunit delta